MHRPALRTGARGLPCALPRFEYHGEFERLDASACNVPPGASATVHVFCRSHDGGGAPRTAELVRARSGRPFLVCPYCGAHRAHLYSFIRRMERRGWTANVPTNALACRTCHRIRYASQYDNRPRDLARGAARFGMFVSARTIRRGETEERRAALAAERSAVLWRRACDRERVRLARAERERRARKRRAAGPGAPGHGTGAG